MANTLRGRFAPSPSGRMHLGNLLCCLLSWLSVRCRGGQVVLRIEDLDTARCPARYADALMEDLLWLGLSWDEGPGIGGPHGPYFQSQRTALYEAALETLKDQTYPCFCTRGELRSASAPHGREAVYPGTCRNLTAAEAALRSKTRRPSLRLRVPDRDIRFTDLHFGPYRENLARSCGDFVLRRSDGLFAYQLAVVVDDAAMGITEVVRGADLLSSTPRQLYLYELLGLDPPRFRHIPLVLAPDGRRLSKRDGDLAMDVLRTRYSPEEIVGQLACLAGLRPDAEPIAAADLMEDFDWKKVPRQNLRLTAGVLGYEPS